MPFNGLFIGLTTIDIQFFVEKFPQSNKKVKTEPPKMLVGGPATNAAVAFAHLNKGAHLVSAVGRNPFSSFIQKDFNSAQIHFTDLTATQKTNPILASVITSKQNGDRNIFTHYPEPIQPEISPVELFNTLDPEILLLDGFYPEFAVDCARFANERQVPVVLDCGSWKSQYQELLQYVNFAICSADFYPPGCSNTDDVFNFLKSIRVIRAAISRGGQSLLFQDEKGGGEVPVEAVNTIDTLGAGDFLHGAFCYYYLQLNFNFEKALEQAAKLATFTCNFEGTRTWINFTEKHLF
jgi:sugar/nucleoside kinase (ribokinase family)